MARHEKDFEVAGKAELPPRDMLTLSSGREPGQEPESREGALACFLSAEDGWIEAARRLGGAFALHPALNQGGKD